MIRAFILIGFLSCAGQAFAGVVFQDFNILADTRFTLSLEVDGAPMQLHGSLRDGDKVTVKQGLVSAELKSYRPASSNVSIVVTSDGQDIASVFLLETSAKILLLNPSPILDRKASVSGDLDGIVAKLADPKGKHWDPGTTFKSMASFYADNPKKQLFQFYDNIELGTVTLAKPAARVATGSNNGTTVTTPSLPAPGRPQQDPRLANQPMQIAPGQQGYPDDGQYDPSMGPPPGRRMRQLPPPPGYGYQRMPPPPGYPEQQQQRDYGGNYPRPLPPPGQYPPQRYPNQYNQYGQGQYNQQQAPPPRPFGIFSDMFGGR